MNVREVMTEDPACCTPDTSLETVAQMMVENDCGALPVVENSNGRKPLGIITDRDITTRTVANGQNPLQKQAHDAMTDTILSVQPSDSVEQCADLMEQKQVRRVVVQGDDGGVIGMIAQADIARRASDDTTADVVEEVSEPSRSSSA